MVHLDVVVPFQFVADVGDDDGGAAVLYYDPDDSNYLVLGLYKSHDHD